MAYAAVVRIGDWFRRRSSGSAGEEAALNEEFGTPPDEDSADVDRIADPRQVTAPGGVAPGLPGTPAAAEAAEAEIASQEDPAAPGR